MESNESKQIKTLQRILEEQMKTNQLLMMLIEAMVQDEADPDDEPLTYMDGSPRV